MPEDVSGAESGELDVGLEDLTDLRSPEAPPAGVLFGLLAEGIALVAVGVWILVVG